MHFALCARTAAATCSLALLGAPALAGVIHVPQDQPTIQTALGVAEAGDEILVAPGTYHGALHLLSKDVLVLSEGGAAVTILDGDGAEVAVTLGNEPSTARLEGFTIRNAHAGVKTSQSDITIAQCIIRDCDGAAAVDVSGSGRPRLLDTTITANAGLGLRTTYTSFPGAEMQVTDCTVTSNGAGGIAGPYIDVVGCTVQENVGVGVQLTQDGSLKDCLVTGNTGSGAVLHMAPADDSTFAGNGGWGVECTGFGATVRRSRFLGNASGGAHLDTFFNLFNGSSYNSAELCLFAHGDGLWSRPVNTFGKGITLVRRCTFDDGSGVDTFTGQLIVTESIVRGTTLTMIGSSQLTVSYTDIEGGAAGAGNIDADPLWVNPAADDYRLQPGSPCINAADPNQAFDPDGSVGEMGAEPYEAWVDLGGALSGTATLAGAGSLVAGTPATLTLNGAPASFPVVLIVGAAGLGAPFKGGTLWPTLDLLVPLATNGGGDVTVAAAWPAGLPAGTSVWAQCWWTDGAGPAGFASSNGMRGTQP